MTIESTVLFPVQATCLRQSCSLPGAEVPVVEGISVTITANCAPAESGQAQSHFIRFNILYTTFTCINISLSLSLHTYTYIYIYIHIHIYIYIYMCIQQSYIHTYIFKYTICIIRLLLCQACVLNCGPQKRLSMPLHCKFGVWSRPKCQAYGDHHSSSSSSSTTYLALYYIRCTIV